MQEDQIEGVFNLYNLPINFISFSDNSIYSLLDNFIKTEYSPFKTISRYTGINKMVLVNLHRKNKEIRTSSMRYDNFIKLYNYLQIQKNNDITKLLQSEIILGMHKGITSPTFPIDFRTKEGVWVVADTLTDGCFSEFGKVSYYNIDPILILDNIVAITTIFSKGSLDFTQERTVLLDIRQDVLKGIKIDQAKEILQQAIKKSNVTGTVRYRKRDWKKAQGFQVDWSTDIGLFLKSLGVTQGNKVVKDSCVPKYIFGLDTKLKCEFVARIIANDGVIGKDGSAYIIKSVEEKIPDLTRFQSMKEWKKTAPKFLIDIYNLLNSSGFNLTPPYLDNTYEVKGKFHSTWVLSISGQNNYMLKSNVKIPHIDKQKKIEEGTTGKFSIGYQRKLKSK